MSTRSCLTPGNGGTINGYVVGLPAAYKLLSGSPMIGAGLNMLTQFSINPGTKDFYGTTIPVGGTFEIGAYEGPGAAGGGPLPLTQLAVARRVSTVLGTNQSWADIDVPAGCDKVLLFVGNDSALSLGTATNLSGQTFTMIGTGSSSTRTALAYLDNPITGTGRTLALSHGTQMHCGAILVFLQGAAPGDPGVSARVHTTGGTASATEGTAARPFNIGPVTPNALPAQIYTVVTSSENLARDLDPTLPAGIE